MKPAPKKEDEIYPKPIRPSMKLRKVHGIDFNLGYGLELVQPLKQKPTFVYCYVPIKQYHEV